MEMSDVMLLPTRETGGGLAAKGCTEMRVVSTERPFNNFTVSTIIVKSLSKGLT